MSEVSIRPMRKGDLAAVLELLDRSLGPGPAPRGEAFWRWKHVDNPFGPSPCLVAEAGERIVGLRAFLRWRWRAGALRLDCLRAVDTATDPDFRGRKIFTRLTRELVERVRAEGAALIFNTPNAKSRPGYLKMGWRSAGRLPLLIRPRRPLRMLAALVRGRQSSEVGPEAPRLAEGLPVVSNLIEALRRGELAIAPPGRAGPRLSTERSLDYLRWRYAAAPGLDYRAVWERSTGGGAGVVCRLRWRRGLRELSVSEILLENGGASTGVAAELLRRVGRTAGADYLVAAAAAGTEERAALRRAGFLPPLRLGPILTVRPLALPQGAPDPLRLGSWRPGIGDFEVF